ncbi:LCP family protein [Pseudokineococcus marinus]|uniref:LytR family transcriptional regulator n=1 Tax=Pseudokineococcus marinus TaxID=351215 RepID=A0A849BNK7_9ACTN|nr:LCP family protein [Pseudokineococcus marinus]NNH22995.1 LytR family transcriptional regulator [Pseudokineococcus marinus]
MPSHPRRRAAVALGAAALLVLGAGGLAATAGRDALSSVARGGISGVDVALDEPTAAPAEESGSGSTASSGDGGDDAAASLADGRAFLLVGSDARGEAQRPGDGDWVEGAQRSDVMMLGRTTPDGDVLVVSLPRDLWVDVPGRGPAKLNAAYSWGGPDLLVDTLRQETGVRVGRFAAIDFDGVVALTDAVGGVTVESPYAFTSRGVDVLAGENTLDGAEALAFLRERESLPRGDLDRVANQQRYLLAMFDDVLSQQTLSDPRRAARVLTAVREHVAVDSGTSFGDLEAIARALGGTRPDAVVAGTVPVAGDGTEGGQSVLYVDRPAADAVWAAFRDGDAERLRELL